MPSPTHDLFLSAMRKKQPIACMYQGEPREVCPIMLGRTGLEEMALVYQFGGRTSTGPIVAGGEWKCLKLAEVREAVLRKGRWHAGDQHSARTSCMKMVEYDVNPDSPYDPAFRL